MNKYHGLLKPGLYALRALTSPIGDLANDIAKDEDFPDEDYFQELWDHISSKCKANSDILETFALAWSYYLASKDPSRPTPTNT